MPHPLSPPTLTTYRYLRVGIVAMALLLGVSLALEVVGSGEPLLGSISAYYATPVRNVFVGALLAIGLGLVAVAGRPGWEESMLNLAGMVAPVVAFVPVAVEGPDGRPVPVEGTTPAGVADNLLALVVVGGLALVFAWFTTVRHADDPSSHGGGSAARWGFAVTVLVWAGFTVWFVGWPEHVAPAAHYVAAVLLFGLIAGIALVEARRVDLSVRTRGLTPRQFRAAYMAISGAMSAVVLLAGVLAVAQWLGATPPEHWVFWVEAALLLLFTGFWVLQTVEYWETGLPAAP